MAFFSKVFDFLKSTAAIALSAVGVGLVLFGGPFASIGYGILASVGISAIQAGLLPEIEDISEDLTTPVRQSVSPAIHIYGETVTAGSFVYNAKQEDTENALFGKKGTYIHQILALAPHEVEDIQIYSIDGNNYIDDPQGEEESDEDYEQRLEDNLNRKQNIEFQYRYGTKNQTALENLPEEWTSEHIGKGIAYVHVAIEEDFEIFPAFPLCLFKVKGKKVKVPGRSDKVWTDNAVAVIRDVIQTLPQISAPDDSFNEAVFVQEYTRADSDWKYEIADGQNVIDRKWSINGAINMGMEPRTILNSLRDHIGGFIGEYAGEWYIRTGEWNEPVRDITEARLLSHISLNPVEPLRNRFNIVKGIYHGPETGYRRTDFEPIEYEHEIEREGKRIAIDLKLNLAKYQGLAQRIGHISLRKLHWTRGIVTALFDPEITRNIKPGDNVTYQDDVLGPLAARYQVVGKQIKAVSGGVGTQLILRRTAPAIYQTPFDITRPPPLPGHGFAGRTTLIPTILIRQEIILQHEDNFDIVLKITVGNVFASSQQIELQYRQIKDNIEGDLVNQPWITLGTSTYGTYCLPLYCQIGDTYEIRARAQTIFGGFSNWNTVEYECSIEPLPELPLPTNLRYIISRELLILSWDLEPSPYLSFTQVRYTPELTDDPKWNRMVIVADQIGRPATTASVPAAVGTYAVRCFNRLHKPTPEFASIQVPSIFDATNWGILRQDEIVPRPSVTPIGTLHNLSLIHI